MIDQFDRDAALRGGDFSAFRAELFELMRWRRDVRHFRPDAVDESTFQECLRAFTLAPSVGLSEPWRLIRVESPEAREAALRNYTTANERALAGYDSDKAKLYASLKLSGMKEAPIQIAVFCDDQTEKGAGLGAGTMPQMRAYSVVGAITLFWIALRAAGLGLGWVSILDPVQMTSDLNVPGHWQLIGYLCIGYPNEPGVTPELETKGWEIRAQSLWMEKR